MATRDETIKLSLIDGVSKNLAAIQQGVAGVGASLTKLNQAAELAGKGFGLVSSAIGGIGNAVSGVADLEDALASLQAVTGASAEDFEKLKAAAVDASERTRFTAIEATQGLTELARAGLTATEAINVLNPALAIAQGNNISVSQSAELLTTTIKQFGAGMGEAARFADVLQAAADGTATSVEQIGSAMSYVAPLARLAGTSIEETSAIIGALADQGFRGERAGTALRNVFSALSDPASKFSTALGDAGIKSRDFTTVIEELSKDSGRAKDVMLALDSEARPAILSLVNSGGAAIGTLTEKFNDATGAAQRTADIMGDTFNGALAKFQNSVANLRDSFLAPILQPLADEFASVSQQLNNLADSPQFARIRGQFEDFATDAIRAIGDLVANVDLEELAGDIADFGTRSKRAFDALVLVVETTATAIRGIAAAIEYVRDHAEDFAEWAGVAAGGATRLNIAAQEAGKGLGHLGGQLDKNKKSTRDFATGADDASKSARQLGGEVKKAGDAAAGAADDLSKMPEAAKLTEVGVGGAAKAAELAALSMAELEKRLALVREALSNAAPGSELFNGLSRDAAALEAQIAATKQKIDEAAGSTENLGNKAAGAAQSLRDMAGAAGEAGDASRDAADAGSQVSESFGNIGETAKAAKADMGNMSEELLNLAIQMQSTARSGKEIIKIWQGVTDQYNESNKRIEQAIKLLDQQNASVNEEALIRRRLEAQYGTDSTLLEELVQRKLRLNNETQRGIELAERETAVIEARNRAQAGTLGLGETQQAATPASTGARGGDPSAAAGVRGPAPSITVNVQGLPDGREGWRAVVAEMIVPELERLGRLSR